MLEEKIEYYRKNFDSVRELTGDETAVFGYIIDLGKKLQSNTLSERKRTENSRVNKCQYDLFVDWEDGEWKAYSNGLISSGYAYILLDVFNSISLEEVNEVTTQSFEPLGISQLLSMNRSDGFYQMIEIIKRNATKV
jgi:sulfur transfer protein SufE